MLERHISKPDRDMQRMMHTLLGGAIKHAAIKLLSLHFEPSEIQVVDLNTRAVLRAVYRLLKAFCSSFPSGQAALAPHLKPRLNPATRKMESLFIAHCEANLVSHDISPMGCINAIFKDLPGTRGASH